MTQNDRPSGDLNSVVASTVIPPQKDAKTLDLDKLAHAIAHSETGDCTKGAGVSRNNCFGVMTYASGKRELKAYKTKEESYADFKRIWAAYYKVFPTNALAKKWTGNDNPKQWLENTTYHYNNS